MFDCDFKYLNLGGLPVTFNNLMLIKRKFLNLKAIDLTHVVHLLNKRLLISFHLHQRQKLRPTSNNCYSLVLHKTIT
ncbi:hypothetical protein BON22_3684 [Cyberlindnera fabianii]|uniref:Uncharacterized protein n=1 Tax=Cyberlindnera fabianii TaxID=36022 RepID=A0A1V2L465_CYBFA|nr:hypothetical protein BON22_3684 [Cyberlindnera fabianii]